MKNFIKIAWIAMISVTIVSAEKADSIRAEIERLTTQLQQVEQSKTEPLPKNIEEAVVIETMAEKVEINSAQTTEDSTKIYENSYQYSSSRKDVSVNIARDDTMLTITKIKTDKSDSIPTTDTTIRTIRITPKFLEHEWNKNNIFGIGGGVALGGILMDMKPLKNHIRNEIGITPSFDNREPMFLIGGFGLGGFVNGVRAGGGGYSTGAEFRTKKPGTDTTIITNVNMGYGGFIIGRGWVKDKNAFHFQTMIGAGRQKVDVQAQKTGKSELSVLNWEDIIKNSLYSNYESKFFACDFQFGYTKSVMRWFHIGAEISSLFMYSRSGFLYDSYASVSPTAKVRFVFGSLR